MGEDAGHLTLEGLGRLKRGEFPAADVIELVKHLLRGCEPCCAQLAPVVYASLAERAEPVVAGAVTDPYEFPFARVFAAVREQALELARARAAAGIELATILCEAATGEVFLLLHEKKEAASPRALWAWCELLVETAGQWRQVDPGGAVNLAELAVGLVEELSEKQFPADALADLQARAWMELGNLLRIREDLDGAQWALHQALRRLRSGMGDRLLAARFLDLTGSLLRARGKFPAALERLESAGQVYEACGETHLTGRTLVNTGIVHLYTSEPERAVRTFSRALDLLDPRREPALTVAAVHNLLLAWIDAGQPERAARILWQARGLYELLGSKQDRIRLLGIEARIAREQGHRARAERLFRREKAEFMAADQPFTASLVALELAGVLIDQGKPAEVLGLVDEMLRTFQALGIQREAVAAVLLLRQAVLQGTATAALAREIATELRRIVKSVP